MREVLRPISWGLDMERLGIGLGLLGVFADLRLEVFEWSLDLNLLWKYAFPCFLGCFGSIVVCFILVLKV